MKMKNPNGETAERKPRQLSALTTAVREWTQAQERANKLRSRADAARITADKLSADLGAADTDAAAAWARLNALRG
jgi:hypothetical protein